MDINDVEWPEAVPGIMAQWHMDEDMCSKIANMALSPEALGPLGYV